jgi:hypothetical protein
MVLIIDAYNMLKQLVRERDVSESQRIHFITLLKKYAQRKRHTLVVVFDGGQYQWVHKEHMGAIQVVYSGVRHTADEYITHYLQEHHTKDVLLISADHELRLVAARLSIPCIDPMDFYALIQQALSSQEIGSLYESQLIKLNGAQVHDVDIVMEQASKRVPVKHVDTMVQRQHHISTGRHKGSRIERKLLQILKKL